MTTYFPFLRGKREELFALKSLASTIAGHHSVYPIIEPVKRNSITTGSFDKFVEEEMPFVFVTNPQYGDYKGRGQILYQEFCVDGSLGEYENYIPALYLYRGTGMDELNDFNHKFQHLLRAVIYDAVPASDEVRQYCLTQGIIYHHILLDGKISTEFTNEIPTSRRILMRDNFKRQIRNSDYPPLEHFTDLNTTIGNPQNINWGDYSIVGDQFSESGGAAMTVAIHHIHKSENSGALEISHFLSDDQETTANIGGKIIQAVQNLVSALPKLHPNDTCACHQYQDMAASGHSKGLGYLKRLAIIHHLETMIANE